MERRHKRLRLRRKLLARERAARVSMRGRRLRMRRLCKGIIRCRVREDESVR